MNLDDVKQEWTYRQVAAICAILLVGFALRIYRIDYEPVWYDEISSFEFLDSPTIQQFFQLERQLDSAMLPVYFTTEYYWARLVGDSVLAVRLLSLLSGMATILVMYLLGRRLYGHWAGCTAALCVAFSKLLIYQSQEIRMYAFVLLFAVVSAYGFVNALDTNKKRWWICNFIANALAMSTHLFAVLFIGMQFVFLLVTRPRKFRLLGSWALAHAIVGGFAMAWFLTTDFKTLEDHVAWIYKPGLKRLFDAYYFVYAGSKLDALDLVRHLPLGIPVHYLLGGFLLAVAAFFVLRNVISNRWKVGSHVIPMVDDRTLFVLFWLILPPFTLFFLTYTVKPCFVERYTLYSCFALYLLVGAGVAKLPSAAWRNSALALLLLLMAGNLVDLWRPMRPDWKSARPVLAELADKDATVYSPPNNFEPTLVFYGGVDQSRLEHSEQFIEEAVENARSGQPTAIAFFEVPDLYEARQVDAALKENGLPAKRYHYPGRWDVYIWDLAAPADRTR